jgi:hypothetical protein
MAEASRRALQHWRMFVPLAHAAQNLGVGLRRPCRGKRVAACLARWCALPLRRTVRLKG